MPTPVWQLDRVSLAGGDCGRLVDVTLSILPGAGVTAVLGPSGAGKTSLLNLLVGFERPDRGRVVVSGDVNCMYWSPQDGGLWAHMTVREHLAAVMATDDAAASTRVDALLDAFDLTARAGAKPDTLSMGERSRLSVARALATGARVLVMDEPLGHVSMARVGKYWDAVRDYVREHDVTLVFATHESERVLAEAAAVICLDAGRVLYHGDVATLYDAPATKQLAECLGATNWFEAGEAEMWLGLPLPFPGVGEGWGEGFAQGSQDRNHGQPPGAWSTVDTITTAARSPHPPAVPATSPPGKGRGGRSVRPEQLAIEPASNTSPLYVQSSRFCGAFAEVELTHEPTGQSRRFLHRPARGALKPGDRVVLRVLMSLLVVMLCGGLSACKDDEAAALPVKSNEQYPMPPDGFRIPAPRAVGIGRDNQVMVLDTAGRVLIFDKEGKLDRQWRMPAYTVGRPEGIIEMQDGRIAVADTHYSRIVFFDQDGQVLSMFGSNGRDPGQFICPCRLVQDDKGYLYVAEFGGNDRIQKFKPDGTYVLSIGHFGTDVGGFQRPSGVVWTDGKLYISDAINNRIQVFTDDGKFIEVLGESVASLGAEANASTKTGTNARPIALKFPYDLAKGADGRLYTVEYGAGRVTALSMQGEVIGRYGEPGGGHGRFVTPWAVAVDPRNRVWVADTGNQRLVELGF